ncbi:MAG TPA: hypothetical protein VFX37_15745 [Pseudolabrys sp.]|nr:hypothetical protein [Pseudolabrys sp.]
MRSHDCNSPHILFVATATIFVFVLAGCSTPESTGRLMVAPGKFVLYSCPELALRAKQNAEREQKLRDLMAKAESGPGGHMASTLTYQPEYDSLIEESRQLRAMQVEKNCKTPLAQGAAPRAGGKTVR